VIHHHHLICIYNHRGRTDFRKKMGKAKKRKTSASNRSNKRSSQSQSDDTLTPKPTVADPTAEAFIHGWRKSNLRQNLLKFRIVLFVFFVYNFVSFFRRRTKQTRPACIVRALRESLNKYDRQLMFHPVVIFPNAEYNGHGGDYEVLDLTKGLPERLLSTLAPSDKVEIKKCGGIKRLFGKCSNRGVENDAAEEDNFPYSIGKYNEVRSNIYETDIFHDLNNASDVFGGDRNIHMGIDFGGPVGKEVYSIFDGVVHSAGYNAAPGDYGNVVVIEYDISPEYLWSDFRCSLEESKLYALYGHLAAEKVSELKEGQLVKKGEVIGYIGGFSENGGYSPHVHFQLSTKRPYTHDMPGAVSSENRKRSLLLYPDPQIVLGQLYKD